MYANAIHADSTRIVPVKPQNKVQTVTKLQSGDLFVTLVCGESYTISKDDELFQAFAVWTVLNSSCTE